MKLFLAVWLSMLLVFPVLAGAQEKPLAAVGRVSSLGNINDTQRQILANRLSSQLSLRYEIISPQEFERAEEEAFAALEAEQCTEENCVRKIQEFLQVERVFILQIAREEDLTQLSLTLFKGPSRVVADDACTACSITDLYPRVEALVNRLVQEDFLAEAGAPGAPETPGKPKWSLWTGLGLLAGAGYMQYLAHETNDRAASKADDARAENSTEAASEAKAIRSDAEEQQTFAMVLGAAALGFVYYYLFVEQPEDPQTAWTPERPTDSHGPAFAVMGDASSINATVTWTW